MISDDRDHARRLLADLQTSQWPFLVTRVFDRQAVIPALGRLTVGPPRRMPVIVMLDFEFLGLECEAIAAQALQLKDLVAVECLVTRPPPVGRVVDTLRRMGVFLFDADFEIAAPLQLLH